MKRALAISFLLSVVLAAGFCWKVLIAQAGRGGAGPSGNGDTNGDGTIDLSDVVYLLDALFLAGPAPVAIEAHAAMGLPATGQTKCYDRTRAEVPCDGADCPGQDASYQAGCPSEGRLVDHGDGTVTDNCTGLMWQKETGDVDGDGQSTEQDSTDWCGALSYCENLSLAGHDDWRLPNVRELQSIVDYGHINHAVDPVFGAFPSSYWSSTSLIINPNFAWFVNFSGGSSGNDDGEDVGLYVRAVRSAF